MNAAPRILTLACLLTAATLAPGCATPRSDTKRTMTETVKVEYFPFPSQGRVAPAMIPGAAEIAGVVFEIVRALAKHVIEKEAEHYTAAFSADDYVAHNLPAGGLILFTRTVKPKSELAADRVKPVDSTDLTDRAKRKLHTWLDIEKKAVTDRANAAPAAPIANAASADTQVNAEPVTSDETAFGLLKTAIDSRKNDGELAFLAIGALLPAASDDPSAFRIHLLPYHYPILKAKNALVAPPFTNWDETDSVLTISLDGAGNDPQWNGAAWSAAASFKVKWDDKAARDPNNPPAAIVISNKSSDAFVVPHRSHLKIGASVVESSDFKDILLKLAEQLDNVDLDDINKLIGDDADDETPATPAASAAESAPAVEPAPATSP